MEFEQLIAERLHPLLIENGLVLVEQYQDFVLYESGKVAIAFSYDPRDGTKSFWVGSSNLNRYEMNDDIFQNLFHSDLKINRLPMETFVNHAFLFLTGVGEKLLKGDQDALHALQKFIEKRSHEYASERIKRQHLADADKAWKTEEYRAFIRIMQKMDMSTLPASYAQKHKIAQKRLGLRE